MRQVCELTDSAIAFLWRPEYVVTLELQTKHLLSAPLATLKRDFVGYVWFENDCAKDYLIDAADRHATMKRSARRVEMATIFESVLHRFGWTYIFT